MLGNHRVQSRSPSVMRTVLVTTLVSVVLLGLLTLLYPHPGIIWDGSWGPEEYRITFKGWAGRPVEGVQLRVENESGSNFYHFPVCDYLPGHVPASDAEGVIVFHHAPSCFVSGHAWWLFGRIPMGDHSEPVYVCRFLLDGWEVHRIRYNDLVNTGTRDVKRRWKWLTLPELPGQVFRTVAWDEPEPDWEQVLDRLEANQMRNFDLNGNGKLDRDERYAARAARMALDQGFRIRGGSSEWEDVEFRLVERTVVLKVP